MKRILITGLNSYIGTSFKKWVSKWSNKYEVDCISVRGDEWKNKSFQKYDTILHVAAIVHVKEKDSERYFRINRDLPIEIADKAKREGVQQFIFLSTMAVYGIETGYITEDTIPTPKTLYAKSKLDAEKALVEMNNSTFKISILRPPLVYGRDCKGNYGRLTNMALNFPVFPYIENKRSMIFIDNLSELIRLIIEECLDGIYFPQNEEYVCTSEMIKLVCKIHGKKVFMTKLFNPLIKLINVPVINKIFGNLVYDKNLSDYDKKYNITSFENSIKLTEENIFKY